jgi:starch synthase (maltosyl-transferring)
VIDAVSPTVDGGLFPAKRVLGDLVGVEADMFADGHDKLAGLVRHRPPGRELWRESPLEPLGNDRWRGTFSVQALGEHVFQVEGWVDAFAGWAADLAKRHAAGQDLRVELQAGAQLLSEAAQRARARRPADAKRLKGLAAGLTARQALSPAVAALVARHPDRASAVRSAEYRVLVEPARAEFSAWYEMFPRSASPDLARSGTLRDVEARLPYVQALGFDVLYLPPIHPIGRSFRKGANNNPESEPADPGSPWAIGSEEGGHRDVHPGLGTLADLRRLVRRARRLGIEVAMDLAYQCSPDHPYVRQHPQWFKHRPDGSIRYAENPPKKYQDIYPLDFETEDWQALWEELCGVLMHWLEQGVRVFRVDNPHTKPFAFWEWLLAQARQRYPDAVFLSEAFTRPKVMRRLAKVGFSQSYTYFAWRNHPGELREYLTELTTPPVADYMRPNLWPNTPDILTEYLQVGGEAASAVRVLLAATLAASYGIYGPVFEQAYTKPLVPGQEEYLDSEKYQVRHWEVGLSGPLELLISRLNAARRAHPALRRNLGLRFLETDNELLLAYLKTAAGGSDPMVTVANLDLRWPQSGWVRLPGAKDRYAVQDHLSGQTFSWHGEWNYVELHPERAPGHLLSVDTTLAAPA